MKFWHPFLATRPWPPAGQARLLRAPSARKWHRERRRADSKARPHLKCGLHQKRFCAIAITTETLCSHVNPLCNGEGVRRMTLSAPLGRTEDYSDVPSPCAMDAQAFSDLG